jgi:hypothetical protein
MTGGVALRVLFAALPLLSACAVRDRPGPGAPAPMVEVVEDPVPLEWTSVITPEDQERLASIDDAWRQGLAAAARYRSAIAREGELLDPTVALPRAAPSPGPYLCRVVKLGARPAFIAYRAFNCFVDAEGELLTMVKANGTQRPAGRLWADSDTRQIFLGALSGEEGASPPPYGETAAVDVAGIIERVGPFRWRLAVPFPQNGATLDVYELVPLIPATP